MKTSLIITLLLLFIILILYLIKRKLKNENLWKANDPSSPFYNWHLDSNLDQIDLIAPWEEIFTSKVVSLKSLGLDDQKKFIIWRERCKSLIKGIEQHYNFEEDIIIVDWKSSADSWENLAGRAGYIFISKSEKKQIDFMMTVMS